VWEAALINVHVIGTQAAVVAQGQNGRLFHIARLEIRTSDLLIPGPTLLTSGLPVAPLFGNVSQFNVSQRAVLYP
jgi:hypothetical protein